MEEEYKERRKQLAALKPSELKAVGDSLGVKPCTTKEQLVNYILDAEYPGMLEKERREELLKMVWDNPQDYVICPKSHLVNLAKYFKETFTRLDFEIKVFCNSVLGDAYDGE